jgi:membrane peptidoglycan carboxypeptidase
MYKAAITKIPLKEKIENIQKESGYVKFENIPQNFTNAIIAIEDHRFYNHGALDFISIGRAIVTNIKDISLTEGGSTLYQQLAKNLYFTQEKKFTRKVAEVFVAFELEKKYSKEEVLELYFNIIYFGNGYTGIGDASKGYFNKEPSKLTLSEIVLLAGLPNAPSIYGLNSALGKERQQKVAQAMYLYKYITKEELDSIK